MVKWQWPQLAKLYERKKVAQAHDGVLGGVVHAPRGVDVVDDAFGELRRHVVDGEELAHLRDHLAVARACRVQLLEDCGHRAED